LERLSKSCYFLKRLLTTLLIFQLAHLSVTAQDTSRLDKLISFPHRLFGAVDKKAKSVEDKLTKATEKYLSKLERREEKLKRKLWKKDSTLAKELFGDVKERYAKLRATTGSAGRYSNVYSPKLDSLNTALSFVNHSKLTQSPELGKTLSSLKDVQRKLNATDQIRKGLAERQKQLKEQFQRLGMVKELKKFRQDVFYYQRQIKEYRDLWEDPSKLERKLMEIVQRLPQFREFFAKNSQLASLFALPGGNASTSVSLAGLQTRASVQQALLDRFGSGPDVTQMLQQNVQSAQGQLNQLKAKAQSYTSGSFGSSEDLDMPEGFKPNNQKTKSFLQRIELGTNIQTQKARYYFPVTTDVALSAGYKLNDKSIIGLGVSYKAGLGSGWDNIAISHQGIGLRSFIDYKLKGSLFITGGYEQNYLSHFQRVEQLRGYNEWQVSGLLGLSKKYKLSKKLKGEMKLLWDFMSYRQVPRTQAVLFRVGYSLK
jgi:hypothetical protein